MADTLTPKQRSERMARIRAQDTKPEMVVRRIIHSHGYRFRLHAKELPGKPDIVLRPRKKAIFVHGCFWHRHPNCSLARLPKSRLDFWEPKLEQNRKRDLKNQCELKILGWDFLVVWECELGDMNALKSRLLDFLKADIGDLKSC
ncbi:DNA mismatch endonuclease Vsr [Thalassospiraceae bacterium LMO-JJ14]|nr:DNA mismatch endonuclease Vsr [Thalassospiraceae bacterium LMO-JJ14]